MVHMYTKSSLKGKNVGVNMAFWGVGYSGQQWCEERMAGCSDCGCLLKQDEVRMLMEEATSINNNSSVDARQWQCFVNYKWHQNVMQLLPMYKLRFHFVSEIQQIRKCVMPTMTKIANDNHQLQ